MPVFFGAQLIEDFGGGWVAGLEPMSEVSVNTGIFFFFEREIARAKISCSLRL